MNQNLKISLLLMTATLVVVLSVARGQSHGHDHDKPPAKPVSAPAAKPHDPHDHADPHEHDRLSAKPATAPAAPKAPDPHDHHDHDRPSAKPATAPAAPKASDPHDHHDHDKPPAKPATAPAVPKASDPHDNHDHDKPPAKPAGAPAAPKASDPHGHNHGDEAKPEPGHTDEVKLTAEAIQRYGIKVAPVSRRALTSTITVPARVSFNADAMAHVGAAVSGRATRIMVRVGDQVKTGDGLLVVESPELGEAQSDFLQKRTAVSVAESAIAPVKGAAERARKLHEQSQGIALGEVQKREAELKAGEGALQSAQAAATAAENKLQLLGMDSQAVQSLVKSSQINPTYTVRASIDGQVIEREVTLGELVSPEKDALLVLADLQTVWVVADVPETRLKDVTVGSEAVLHLAAADGVVRGKVARIAPILDAGTRTGQVRMEVPNPDGQLRPGMFATAEITSTAAAGEPVIAVPDNAVQTVEGESAVFVPVVGEANTFAKRAVTVGAPVGRMRPIISGLKEGEQIVVSGTFLLKAELGKSGAAHEH